MESLLLSKLGYLLTVASLGTIIMLVNVEFDSYLYIAACPTSVDVGIVFSLEVP